MLVLVASGYGWSQFRSLDAGIRRSGNLADLAAPTGATENILVMGLDSRLDENGDPLPAADYAAMDTGGADVGGYNANVLMLLHIPGDGSRSTALSIPRDDYVDLPGSPDGQDQGKIKQAYGLAFDQQHKALTAQHVTDRTTVEQRSRDAGRNAEIATVSQFLGVPVDHFVEVTMVAFYQLAQVVQPITVCLNEDTQDNYSGANFHAGYQQISAAQAVAFVRQRRDYLHPQLNFTDLDRERRQQAFIASLAYQLKQGGTFADPTKLAGLMHVAQQNTAVDPGLDLLALAGQAAGLTTGNISFTTLPIERFGTDPAGEAVNIVDVPTVQATVVRLLSTTTAGPSSPGPAPDQTVDILNGGGRSGLAATVSQDLTARGYTPGTTGDAAARTHSIIEYPPGDEQAATTLATALGISDTTPDSTVATGHLRVLLGHTFTGPPFIQATTTPQSAPTDTITGGGIPCVK